MEELYKKSVQALKEYDKKPSVKEWNKIAEEYNFLSTKTMCRISGLCWNQLCFKLRRRI